MINVLRLDWDNQTTDIMVTIEGGTMRYSNGNDIWQLIRPGVNICLALGVGPYILEEEVSCTVTKCGFNDTTTSPNIIGSLRAEFGSLETTNQMFHNCSGLTSLDIQDLDTRNVTDMLSMFYNCAQITTLDVSNFDTTNATTMQQMFNGCPMLTELELSSFNTSGVETMLGMFSGCSGLLTLDLTSFNTSNVKSMSAMFSNCTSLTHIDVSRFDTSQVTILAQMFSGCISLVGIDISSFDTNQTLTMTNMFWGCSSLLCISNLNTTGAVSGRGGIFAGCGLLILPDTDAQLMLTTPSVGGGGTSWRNVAVCPPPVTPLTITWDSQSKDTSVTIENAGMYYSNDGGGIWAFLSPGTHILEASFGPYELKELVPGSVSRCAFNDISCSSNFDGGMVAFGGAIRSAEKMFFECTSLKTLDIINLGMGYCRDTSDMFSNCRLLSILDVGNFDTSLVENMAGMFNGCSSLITLDVSSFNTDIVNDMSMMFAGCALLSSIDTTVFNTAAVLDFSYMFWGCENVASIDISSFNAFNAIYTKQMFSQCSSLTHLDLSSFITDGVHDMKAMFYKATNLICITNLNTTAANNPGGRDSLFTDCIALVNPDITAVSDLTDAGGADWVNSNDCM